ncbi:hypothetical protein AVEN_165769-1 [Araneus ventricosus]|uniref:Uncharacterized protein n=1 Tax=Araneus ventricosus TaxID=182803 RepID=A0A4Y2N2E4_ARAVE|nr:hypothetical protein AVEN_165769-1 [Araneus ventricosus]
MLLRRQGSLIVYSGRPWRHMKSSSTFKYLLCLAGYREIPVLPIFRHQIRQICHQGQRFRHWLLCHHARPCKTLPNQNSHCWEASFHVVTILSKVSGPFQFSFQNFFRKELDQLPLNFTM